MTWKDINVFQWQQIVSLFTKEKDLNELDLAVKAVAVCTNMTENQIDSLPLDKLKPLINSINFIHSDLKPEPQKYIQVNGTRYRCIYDVRKIPAARYIETKYFGADVTNNLHKIAACMVIPQRHTLFGWKDIDYDASRHEEYANDLLEAPITAVLGSVVFFYQVYRNWIKISKDYLVQEMMKKNMTKYQAELVYQTLCETLDGFIKPQWLQSSKELHSKKPMSYQRFNSLMTSLISKQKANTNKSN